MVALQDDDPDALDEHILQSYPLVMDRLFAGLEDLEPGMHIDVEYAELVRRPVDTIERIYVELGLEGFAAARPSIARFAAENIVTARPPSPLEPALARQIGERWRRQITRLGYGPDKACPA